MLKGIQFLIVLFIIPGFPLLQCDQVTDYSWVVSEDALAAESEHGSFPAAISPGFVSEPILPAFNQTGLILRLFKSPFYFLYSSFEGFSPFWRPPPV
jgi:hypothetical protein